MAGTKRAASAMQPRPQKRARKTPTTSATPNESKKARLPETTRKVLSLGDLPRELIWMIYSRCDLVTAGTLRLVCSGIAEKSREFLFKRVCFSVHPKSVRKLLQIARYPVVRPWVKTVVYEDIEVLHPDYVLMEVGELSKSEWETYCEYQNSVQEYRLKRSTTRMICRALALFLNLETLEYCSGPKEMRAPGQDADSPLGELLRVDDSIPLEREDVRAYEERLWADRGSGRLFGTPFEDGDDGNEWYKFSIEQFHDIVQSVLQNRSPDKPFHLEYDTNYHRVLELNRMFPADNAVQSLEIRYRGDMAYVEDSFVDFKTLADPAMRAQWSNLMEIKLVGKSIENQEALYMKLFPDMKQFPDWPRMELVDLTNVHLAPEAWDWLKGLSVDLKVKNVLFDGTSYTQFLAPINLHRARFSGLYGHLKNKVPGKTRGWRNNSDDLWILGTEQTAAWTADRYLPYMMLLQVQKGWRKAPHVSPDAVENYTLHGGKVPFTSRNRLAKTEILAWRDKLGAEAVGVQKE